MSPELLGWSASLILVVTIAYQVYTQWQSGDSDGVSPWLFIGQLVASTTFVFYAVLIGSTVFIVTNALMALSAVTGLTVCMVHQRRDKKAAICEQARPRIT